MINVLLAAGFDVWLCWVQVNDGVGNMAVRMTGCQARFFWVSTHLPTTIFCCKLSDIYVMIDNLKTVGLFFQFSLRRRRHQLESSMDSE